MKVLIISALLLLSSCTSVEIVDSREISCKYKGSYIGYDSEYKYVEAQFDCGYERLIDIEVNNTLSLEQNIDKVHYLKEDVQITKWINGSITEKKYYNYIGYK